MASGTRLSVTEHSQSSKISRSHESNKCENYQHKLQTIRNCLRGPTEYGKEQNGGMLFKISSKPLYLLKRKASVKIVTARLFTILLLFFYSIHTLVAIPKSTCYRTCYNSTHRAFAVILRISCEKH